MRSWGEAVYSCIGNCIAAQQQQQQQQQQSISFTCTLQSVEQQQPSSRLTGKIRCPRASQVWPVQPSSASHEVGRPRDDARRGE